MRFNFIHKFIYLLFANSRHANDMCETIFAGQLPFDAKAGR